MALGRKLAVGSGGLNGHPAHRWHTTAIGLTNRRAFICGDNLTLMRRLAGFGRLREPALANLVLAPLLTLWTHGWDLSWFVFTRAEDTIADALALLALRSQVRTAWQAPAR